MTGHNVLLQMHFLLYHGEFFSAALKTSTPNVVAGFNTIMLLLAA
jgi:hypothetical protein